MLRLSVSRLLHLQLFHYQSNTTDVSRLMIQNFVPDTSRSPRPGEVEGQDYFFVTREEFESDMHRDRFLEHEEYKGAYYGTSFTSIKRIMESSRIPVLDVHPQVCATQQVQGCIFGVTKLLSIKFYIHMYIISPFQN